MKSMKVSTWYELANCPAIGVDVCKKHLDLVGLCGLYRLLQEEQRIPPKLSVKLPRPLFSRTLKARYCAKQQVIIILF